jgi:3-oxoacyl-[acyl-carrier-protein] synthase III
LSDPNAVVRDQSPWVVATAHALPAREVLNTDLPATLGIDAAAIEKKTGIRARRWADEGVYTSDLGAEACSLAMAKEAIDRCKIDCIIAATQSADHAVPGIGVIIQAKLKMQGIPCFDLRNQCSNFLYALQIAQSFIRSGTYKAIMIVCAEVQSHALGLDHDDASVTPLFGDGAAAAIVAASPSGKRALRLTRCFVGADGEGADKLRQRVWDVSQIPPWDVSRLPEPARQIRYAEMQGEAVFRAAVKGMVESAKCCLEALRLTVADIDWLVPHQANASINKTVASILGFESGRVLSNIADVGNVSGASLPILLSQTLETDRILPGDRLLLVAFGAGFTWGSAVFEVGHASSDNH